MKRRTRLAALLHAGLILLKVSAFTSGSVAYAANNGVEIANYGTGKCLTVQNGSRSIGAPVIQSICGGLRGQHWIFQGSPGGIRQVFNLDTGLCIGAVSFDNGGLVVQRPCGNAEAGTFWSVTDLTALFPQRKITLKIYTVNACLDLENGDIHDGVPLQVWQCNPHTDNQIWKVSSAPTAP